MAGDAADDEFDDPDPITDDGRRLSVPRLVFGVHVVTAAGALGVGVLGLLGGSAIQLVIWGAIAGMMLVAGVAASRIAARRD
jgi:hypothetical protein